MTTTTDTTDTTAAAPFAPGDRVERSFDGVIGTVQTVTPYVPDNPAGEQTYWAVAVQLDHDGEVRSGTEVAWRMVELDEVATITDTAATCGDQRDGYVCTARPHDPATSDHAETRWINGRVPYVAAFWNDGSGITGRDNLVEIGPR